mmetsp:Transcript_32481/g.49702  ORF Transcript_32481/g.49702 Transcript_32481/m.49702 type:complete len:223 (-) Transcript_32481:18-686(-)
MKFLLLSASAALAEAFNNHIPILAKLPAWQRGNPEGELDIQVFYDPLCPGSRDASRSWDAIADKESPVAGKTYAELANFRVSLSVLPYHLHAYQMTQLYYYFFQQKAEGLDLLQDYLEFCWDNIGKYDESMSEKDFKPIWSIEVANQLGLLAGDLRAVYADENSDLFTRKVWKVPMSNGIATTPGGTVNDIVLDQVPMTEEDWEDLFKSLYPESNEENLHLF